MKKIIIIIVAVILIGALSACSSSISAFNGSRTGNDSQFLMEYTAFNMTDYQELNVEAGDTVHAEIVVRGGLISYKIQNDNGELIANSKGISTSEEFDLKVDKSGTYTVTVTGERAKGSVKFVVRDIGKSD